MHSPFRRAASAFACTAAIATASAQSQSPTPPAPAAQSITVTGNYDNAVGSSDAASSTSGSTSPQAFQGCCNLWRCQV